MYGNFMASSWTFGIIAGCLTLLAGAVELDDHGLVEALPYLFLSCLFFCGAWFLTSYLKGRSLKERKEAPLNSSHKEKGDETNQVRPS
jgi:hypothetical protein